MADAASSMSSPGPTRKNDIVSLNTYPTVELRPCTQSLRTHIPANYTFLEEGAATYKYRINFRHPAYPIHENILFSLYAWDHPDGGIHHGLAHCACAIIANNCANGFLTTTWENTETGGERINGDWDNVLPVGSRDYYFYVPYPSTPYDGSPRPPYRWPVVPTFQDWRFPTTLPDVWERTRPHFLAQSNTAAQSNLTSAVNKRDITCKVSGFSNCTEVAHLIPEHESQWFLSNSMSTYNTDLTLDPENLTRDLSNAVLLRSDIHSIFDQRKFVFFPKHAKSVALHMLEPTSDYGPLYHNTLVDARYCALEFLFARFAWSLFPSLSGFLSRPNTSRFVIHVKNGTQEQVAEEVTKSLMLGKKAAASRSNSPTKRSRAVADLGDNEDVGNPEKYQRTDDSGSCDCSSLDSIEAETHEYMIRREPFPELSSAVFMSIVGDETALPLDPSECARWEELVSAMRNEDDVRKNDGLPPKLMPQKLTKETKELFVRERDRINKLRDLALAKQRPEGFTSKRSPYDRHRPAKEELELMGVEIFDDSDIVAVKFEDI